MRPSVALVCLTLLAVSGCGAGRTVAEPAGPPGGSGGPGGSGASSGASLQPPDPGDSSLPPNQPELDDVAQALDEIAQAETYRSTYCDVELDLSADVVWMYTTTTESAARIRQLAERKHPDLRWSQLRVGSARYPVARLIKDTEVVMSPAATQRYHLVSAGPDGHCSGLQVEVDEKAVSSGAVPPLSRLRTMLQEKAGVPVTVTAGPEAVASDGG